MGFYLRKKRRDWNDRRMDSICGFTGVYRRRIIGDDVRELVYEETAKGKIRGILILLRPKGSGYGGQGNRQGEHMGSPLRRQGNREKGNRDRNGKQACETGGM